jgi:hypothetical protein
VLFPVLPAFKETDEEAALRAIDYPVVILVCPIRGNMEASYPDARFGSIGSKEF